MSHVNDHFDFRNSNEGLLSQREHSNSNHEFMWLPKLPYLTPSVYAYD